MNDVDRWLNPELFVVTPRGAQASLDDVFALVESTYPDVIASSVTFPARADASLSVFLRARQARTRQRGEIDTLPFNTVFVDPYELRVLGHRSSLGVSWTRAEAIPILLRFHYTLLQERAGVWVMGTCAGLWLVTNVLGLALAWPSAWTHARAWLRTMTVSTRRGAYTTSCELHRAIGLWLLPVLTVLAFTSVYLAFPLGTRSAIAAIAPVTPSPAGRRFEGTPPVTPESALQRARAVVPSGRPSSLFREQAAAGTQSGCRCRATWRHTEITRSTLRTTPVRSLPCVRPPPPRPAT